MTDLSPEQKLDNLLDAELKNILEMTDEETLEDVGGAVDCTACGWHGPGRQLVGDDGGCPECGDFGTAVVPIKTVCKTCGGSGEVCWANCGDMYVSSGPCPDCNGEL